MRSLNFSITHLKDFEGIKEIKIVKLAGQRVTDKIYVTKKRDQAKLELLFDHYHQTYISGGKSGVLENSPSQFYDFSKPTPNIVSQLIR